MTLVNAVVDFFVALPGRILDAIQALPGLVSDIVTTVHDRGIFIFADMARAIVENLGKLLDSVIRWGTNVLTSIVNALRQVPGIVGSFFQSAFNTTTDFLGRIVNAVANIPIVQKITEIMRSFLGGIKDGWNQVNDATGGALNRWVGIVVEKAGSVISTVREIPGRVAGAIGNLGGLLYDAGVQLVQGLANGIRDAAGAKHLLGISSPSKVFRDIGLNVGAGFVTGLDASGSRVQAAVGRLTNFDLGNFSTPNLSAAVGGSSVPVSSGNVNIVNTVNLPVQPFTPGQVVDEATSALREMERAQRYR
jgi:hypothetical protein